MSRHPRAVVLSHGDQEARDWFKDQIQQLDPACKVIDPPPLKTVKV
jgi:hypothetical protein